MQLKETFLYTLRAIAQALDTPLYHLFREEITEDPVVHPQTRLVIGSVSEPDVQYQLLTRDTKGSIEFCMMVIPPHKSSCRDINSHVGEEAAYVCAGEAVELDMDGQLLTLQVGDSLRIPGNVPHIGHNPTDVTVQVIFAINPPTF